MNDKTYADVEKERGRFVAKAIFAVRFGLETPYDPTRIAFLGNVITARPGHN